jgi:co-chaperonin GroES (HSP10)
MQVIPIGKKVLVKPVERKTQTKGGIYLPESQQKQPPQGVIVARGEDVTKGCIKKFLHIKMENGYIKNLIHKNLL